MTIGQSGLGGAPSMSEVGANEAPVFVSGQSGTGDIFRRIAAVLAAIVVAAVLIVSAAAHAADSFLSTKTHVASEMVTALSTNTAKTDITNAAMSDIEAANPNVAATLTPAETDALESDIRSEITAPPVQSIVRTDVERIYTDLRTGTADTINLQPLVQPFLAKLHRADPAVSDVPSTYATSYLWHIRKSTGIGRTHKLQDLAWILTLVGLLGALAVARFLLRHRPVKLIGIFVMIGLPGLGAALIGVAVSRAPSRKGFSGSNNHLYTAVLKALLGRVGTVLIAQGLVLLLVALAVMALWGGWWLIRRQASPPLVGAT